MTNIPKVKPTGKESAVATPLQIAGIKNFRKVNDWLYRGGQPDAQGFRMLQELGIKTVVSLRWGKRVVDCERSLAAEHGINFVSIRLNYFNFPTAEQIDSFLAMLDDPSQHPVYVHCLHGCDRTGIMLAIYRMAREGWHADHAYREMRDCGFHKIRMYHFKWVVYGFAARSAPRPAVRFERGRAQPASTGED